MTGLGHAPIQPFSIDVILQTQQHLPRMKKQGLETFELHWNLVRPGVSYSIDSEGLWKHTISVPVVGFNAMALSPEDLLLYL
jgi:hypothetical protein